MDSHVAILNGYQRGNSVQMLMLSSLIVALAMMAEIPINHAP